MLNVRYLIIRSHWDFQYRSSFLPAQMDRVYENKIPFLSMLLKDLHAHHLLNAELETIPSVCTEYNPVLRSRSRLLPVLHFPGSDSECAAEAFLPSLQHNNC